MIEFTFLASYRNMKSSVFNILEDVSEAKFPGFNKVIHLFPVLMRFLYTAVLDM